MSESLAAFLWLAQGLGGIFAGGSTDPSSGPLLILLPWPTGPPPQPGPGAEPRGA